ncbi:MAG: hypothetical protein QOH86_2022 [Sphingomonadales bacterium]|nr:hypothetical protein [Sphingomonadales bacterium]
MSHSIRSSTTRRAVVAGLAAAAGSTIIAAPARALAPRSESGPGAKSEFEQWRALTGRNFRVAAENGACALSLVAVRALPAKGARPAACARPHAFAAVFEARTAAAPAGDRSYAVQHADLGTFPLFLGTGDREAGKLRFVAIFN